jgi:hypothetical protein
VRQLGEIEQFDRDDVPVTIADTRDRSGGSASTHRARSTCSPSRSSWPTQPDEHHQHDRDRFRDATLGQR